MKELRVEIKLFCALALMLLVGCSSDEEPIVETPGNIEVSNLSASFEGVRGNDVSISFTATAQDGISKVLAVVNNETTELTATGTSYDGSLSFTIPADAILNTAYDIMVEVTDVDGDKATGTSMVVAAALITEVPTTYAFEREGATTVSFSGQDERLNQVEEIKDYLKTGDSGEQISAAVLSDAYANVNDDGNGFFSFSSTKQLKNKSFQPDVDEGFMTNLFAAAEAASASGAVASNGVAGLIVRENSGNTVLVDANGREFTQMIEKGLMGTVMYNQIYNTYFSDDRLGDDVENTELSEGKNYTSMEHHMDEAFGYWSPPLDFTSNWPSERGSEDRFWSHYSNVVDPFLGTNDKLMQGFLTGRSAIVNNDLAGKDVQRTALSEQLELVAAGTAVHYINQTIAAINEGNTGEAFHTLSEAWTFVNALKYNPNRRMPLDQIERINEVDFGVDGNFWNVTVDGLNNAKNQLVTVFTEIENSKDEI